MHARSLLGAAQRPAPVVPARPVMLTGMWGFGDSIHQRAIVAEMRKTQSDIYLQTCYGSLFADKVREGGLALVQFGKNLTPRIREGEGGRARWRPAPRNATIHKITYDASKIHEHGSILAAQFAAVGLRMPERPDFSLPVPDAWRERARRLIATWKTDGKPILMYRPIVVNDVWNAPSRSPDPDAYASLFALLRERFFCVSFANIGQGGERLVGPRQDVDVRLERGEADFETLAGLFRESALVFGNAGFTPVLAQAVGAPNIIVYGGNESFRTTNSVGAHLAPTLAIEPDKPCECHAKTHACDKRITLGPAAEKIASFVAGLGAKSEPVAPVSATIATSNPRTLIFGTVYADTKERARLTRQWAEQHRKLNPDCDFLLVDSKSPEFWGDDGSPAVGVEWPNVLVDSFPDNIGHLSRGGRDGWGRAFCKGLETAIERGYDYAVHIEGDSLFKLPVLPVVRQMQRDGIKVASVPVEGTKRKEIGWVETGLMFFDVNYVRESGFIAKYDWPNRTVRPTPERVIFDILKPDLKMMPWRAERGDKSQITVENVGDLDWVTHCHGQPEIYDRFVALSLGETRDVDAQTKEMTLSELVAPLDPLVKLNFGCGKNKLAGWVNYDREIDIAKPLPFADGYADFIFAEHVVEHVPYKAAYAFLRECRRVLKPGGTVRIAVPSIEQVLAHADDAYVQFTKRWAPEAGKRGAVRSLIEAHGHECGWTGGLLATTLYAAGFDHVQPCCVGESMRDDLRGVEGHHKIIGEKMNLIETVVCEAW